jgi:hypothetical protein
VLCKKLCTRVVPGIFLGKSEGLVPHDYNHASFRLRIYTKHFVQLLVLHHYPIDRIATKCTSELGGKGGWCQKKLTHVPTYSGSVFSRRYTTLQFWVGDDMSPITRQAGCGSSIDFSFTKPQWDHLLIDRLLLLVIVRFLVKVCKRRIRGWIRRQ